MINQDNLLGAPTGDAFVGAGPRRARRSLVATGPEAARSIEEVPGKWPAAASMGFILAVCGGFWALVGFVAWWALT